MQLESQRDNLRQEIETNENDRPQTPTSKKRAEAIRELPALKQRFKTLSIELKRLIEKRTGAPSETIELEEFNIREKDQQEREKQFQQQ